jgi:hypothetical protein
VELERSGSATIDHAITMQIKGGPLRSFDLAVSDADVSPLDGTAMSAQTESQALPVPLGITPRPDGALHVTVDSPKGLSHGTFVFHVRYKKSLLTREGIQRDGAMLRVAWTGPAWQEGLDNAKCTFVLPSAPTEPRAPGVRAPGESDDDGEDAEAGIFISDVKRSTDHDEVELIRPHVARNESVRWSVRVDPRALGDVNDPRLRPPAPAAAPQVVPPERRAAYAALAGALLLGLSLLAFLKARQVKRLAAGAAEPRPLIPLGSSVRALLAGPAFVGGLALQVGLDDPRSGSWLVLLAMALVWYLQPTLHRAPRGPGRWLPISDAEAFARAPRAKGTWLDARTPSGCVVFALSLAVVAALAWAASRVSTYDAYLVVFDGAILFPLFGTGSVRDLPGDPVSGPGPLLGRIAEKLRRRKSMRAIAWARLPEGSDRFDELRLLCAPKVPLRGFTGIEVGHVGVSGLGGFIYLPEVLVRLVDGSPCYEAFVKCFPGVRWIRGRRADERVASFRPRLPTCAMTTALALRLLDGATETAPPRTRLPRPASPTPRTAPAKPRVASKAPRRPASPPASAG